MMMTHHSITFIILATFLSAACGFSSVYHLVKVARTLRYERRSPASSASVLSMAGGQVPVVPYFPDKQKKRDNYIWMDIYNALGRDRTLFVGRYLDDEACNQLIGSLIWLQGQSDTLPITMYFNVPGSQTKPALAVFDVMRRMKCPIKTINIGLTVGMGALLCSVGTTGERMALPNARFLMSRTGLDDGIQGQASDLRLHVIEVLKDNERAVKELAKLCGQPTIKLEQDLKRDFYLTAAEAAAYGLIDKVMMPEQPVKLMRYRGDDDDVIGFGHFSEYRRVKDGPADVIKPIRPNSENEEFDEYAMNEMKKKGFTKGRPAKTDRFANSRLKPPGYNKPKLPPADGDEEDNGSGGGDKSWKSLDNFFP